MKKLVIAIMLITIASGTQAASVLATTNTGTVIKNTPFERKKAQQAMFQHCLANGKIAILVNEAVGFPSMTSTFVCN